MYKVFTIISLLLIFNLSSPYLNSQAETMKGIYLTANSISTEAKFNHFVNLIMRTGLNTVVIDVKNDEGMVTYDSNLPLVNQVQSDKGAPIKNLPSIIQKLKDKNIYTIARIVVFKDPYLAKNKPEWAIKRKNQTLWKDAKGVMWIDPYRKEVWDYSISIAREVAQLGFDEIQWDYVRFPDYKNLDNEVSFPYSKERSKEEAIEGFLKYAYSTLKNKNLTISADVFGLTTTAKDDMGIGQKWERITQHVDVISPMMYPSHYANGAYGIANPENNPYQLIKEGLKDAIEKNNNVKSKGKSAAKIRPWYQDFDKKIPYDLTQVQEQINAGKELGIGDYLLWNARNEYSF
jgi:hypothetical protein